MAKKKTTTKRSTGKSTSARRRSPVKKRTGKISGFLGRLGIPLVICCLLIAVLGLLTAVYYRAIAESDFFKLKAVDVRGVERSSENDIRRIVTGDVEKTGIIDADISVLREKIEQLPFIKTVSVSRQYPSGIRVDVVERVPSAIVRLKNGDHLIDSEGTPIAPAKPNEKGLPFALIGWDEAKTKEAIDNNKLRLKIYRQMLDEWSQYGLSSRVRKVDLSSLAAPSAYIEDSGSEIAVVLSKKELGKSLKTAIEAVAGKGAKIRSINVADVNPVINFIDF